MGIKIDWYGTTNRKAEGEFTIFEHWAEHIKGWKTLSKNSTNTLVIKYEDLKDQPYTVYKTIHSKFFSKQKLLLPDEIDPITKPLGLLPNKGSKNAWKDYLGAKNNEVFKDLMSKNNIDYGC